MRSEVNKTKSDGEIILGKKTARVIITEVIDSWPENLNGQHLNDGQQPREVHVLTKLLAPGLHAEKAIGTSSLLEFTTTD